MKKLMRASWRKVLHGVGCRGISFSIVISPEGDWQRGRQCTADDLTPNQKEATRPLRQATANPAAPGSISVDSLDMGARLPARVLTGLVFEGNYAFPALLFVQPAVFYSRIVFGRWRVGYLLDASGTRPPRHFTYWAN